LLVGIWQRLTGGWENVLDREDDAIIREVTLSKKRCVEKGKHDHALKIF
jgi:hypothetical protein